MRIALLEPEPGTPATLVPIGAICRLLAQRTSKTAGEDAKGRHHVRGGKLLLGPVGVFTAIAERNLSAAAMYGIEH